MKSATAITLALLAWSTLGRAQAPSAMAKLGYPQMIVYNAKIVTMDDDSFEPRVGRIVQAMAVRDGKILSTGSNNDVRALAGPQTKILDLKGRTVLPGFTSTHEHPTSWAFVDPHAFLHVLPGDDVVITRWMDFKPPKEQLAQFDSTMREAVSKAKPGQWIMIEFNLGPDWQLQGPLGETINSSIKKEYLDVLAPNNPVIVKDGFIGAIVNQKAYDALHAVHPALLPAGPVPYANPVEGPNSFQTDRWFEPDAMFQGKLPVLADVLKSELELWASWGSRPSALRLIRTIFFRHWIISIDEERCPAALDGATWARL